MPALSQDRLNTQEQRVYSSMMGERMCGKWILKTDMIAKKTHIVMGKTFGK